MIKRLGKKTELVTFQQDYERAAQIRDRIKELRRYASDDQLRPSAEGGQEFIFSK